MAEDEKEFASRKWVAIMALAAAILGGGVGSLGLVRVDGFTTEDWKLKSRILRLEIVAECKDYVDKFLRPPLAARIRIIAVEKSSDRTDPEYELPTDEWQ